MMISLNPIPRTIRKAEPLGQPRHQLSLRMIAASWTLVSLGAVLNSGCTPNPPVEFQFRESTRQLAPNARQAVEHTLLSHFGTPEALVVWDRLPVIDFGGAKATVESVAAGKTPESQLSVVISAPESDSSKTSTSTVRVGVPVRWISGGRSSIQGDRVAAFDKEKRQLTISLASPSTAPVDAKAAKDSAPVAAMPAAVAAGDELVIDDGGLLAQGRVVYQKNCMHCHGTTGDGNGPTAKYMQPPPRDYRSGIFKFTSTQAAERVTRADLTRILDEGIPGTYMPSFLLMDETEKKAVIEYVRWLSIRGELEKRLTDELTDFSTKDLQAEFAKNEAAYKAAVAKGEKAEPPAPITPAVDTLQKDFAEFFESDYLGIVEDTTDFLKSAWERAEEPSSIITPTVVRTPDDAASRERGRLLYLSDKTKCYTCHGPQGKGDGPANFEYWKMPTGDGNYPRPGLHDLWGNPLPARDLTRGIYRGGRKPVDLYRRMYAGIKGTPMPAFGGITLTDAEIWDLVNYILSVEFTANGTGSVPTPEAFTGSAPPSSMESSPLKSEATN